MRTAVAAMIETQALPAARSPLRHVGPVLLALCPFMQLGHGIFLSVMAALLIVLLLVARPRQMRAGWFVLPIGFLLSVMWLSFEVPAQAGIVARDVRVMVGGVILLVLLCSDLDERVSEGYVAQMPLCMLLVLLLIAVAQKLLLSLGSDPFLPSWLFANSSDYSLGSSRFAFAKSHGLEFSGRVSGFFSEPSYLGAVALYLHLQCLWHLSGRQRLLASIAALLLCGLAQTVYGLTANLVLLLFFHRKLLLGSLPVVIVLIGILLIGLPQSMIGAHNAAVVARIGDILRGDDTSTNIRLSGPLQVIEQVLWCFPFGIPLSAATDYFASLGMYSFFGDRPFQNGLFNLVVMQGWLGFVALALIFRYAGGGVLGTFALLLLMQNGATFEFDKIVMISSGVLFCRPRRAASDTAPSVCGGRS